MTCCHTMLLPLSPLHLPVKVRMSIIIIIEPHKHGQQRRTLGYNVCTSLFQHDKLVHVKGLADNTYDYGSPAHEV